MNLSELIACTDKYDLIHGDEYPYDYHYRLSRAMNNIKMAGVPCKGLRLIHAFACYT